MQNLILEIATKADISEDQARLALFAVSEHVKEKYPLLHGAVDSVLGAKKVQASFIDHLFQPTFSISPIS